MVAEGRAAEPSGQGWRRRVLRRRTEFTAVARKGRGWSDRLLLLRGCPNCLDVTRFGFAIGKGVGKAVVRNRVRRRLREVIRRASIVPGWDLVFVVRQAAADASYEELRRSVEGLVKRAGLLDGSGGGQ